MNLELMAMRYLRFERGCPVALFERSPRPTGTGDPDVLGITQSRFLLEIEIKRTIADFRANARKYHLQPRYTGFGLDPMLPKYPKLFWFLAPADLALSIALELPAWAGLLRGPAKDEQPILRVVTPAPVNNASLRLTTKECVKLARCMANQILAGAEIMQRQRDRLNEF